MTDIALHDLNDRELLILAVQGVNETREHLRRQNGRIAMLEAWRNLLAGGLAVILALIPIAIALAKLLP